MKRTPENQCRRCGSTHDDSWQLIDPGGCWAVITIQCGCGHQWTLLHTAPGNLGLIRGWIARGCNPSEGPIAAHASTPWQLYRLEGVCPALIAAAS